MNELEEYRQKIAQSTNELNEAKMEAEYCRQQVEVWQAKQERAEALVAKKHKNVKRLLKAEIAFRKEIVDDIATRVPALPAEYSPKS